MDAEHVRTLVKKLPFVEETLQWGETLVFWVGDKAVGGKMFALVSLEGDAKPVLSFSAGPEAYQALLETEGVIPAPYMARIHWVALAHWNVLAARELAERLANAHALTFAKMSKRTRDAIALPARERRQLIVERERALAAKRKVASENGRTVASAKKAGAAARNAAPAGSAGSKAVRRSRKVAPGAGSA